MNSDDLDRVNAARRVREAVLVIKDLNTGENRLVRRGEAPPGDIQPGWIAGCFASGKGMTSPDGRLFLAPYLPSLRLIVIGAVHTTQALIPMARAVDLDCHVVDPRTAFATEERFPSVPVHAEWPETVMPQLKPDAYTAVAALTHDPKIDDPALLAALDAGCFYVGALGSRKTHAKRLDRLSAAGVGQAELQQIKAPIGLDIGAAKPAEIAVSILAEIIAHMRRDGRA